MKYLAIPIVCVAALIGAPVRAATTPICSTIEECQAKYNELEQQAAAKRAVIATTEEQANTLKNQIAGLQNQISAVQAEVNAIGANIQKTDLEIGTFQQQIDQKRDDITQKRESIGRMVFFLDQKDREDIIASLFKYATLSDVLSQVHDIAIMQGKILQVIEDIKEEKASLEQDQASLEGKQQTLQELQDQAAQRKNELASAKGEKNRVLVATKGQEAVYQQELTKIEEQKTEFFIQMQQFEKLIISGGLYIVHVTATSVPPKGTKLFIKPEDNPRLTQGYGCTKYARCGNKRGPYGGSPHNGVDYASGFGAPIKAIGDGTIAANGTNDGWGNWIAIKHPNNMVSLYAHMSSLSPLKVGTDVTQGQVIGYEGHTGAATGSHVHLSIYKDFFTYVKDSNGQLYFNYFEGSLNPLDYLK